MKLLLAIAILSLSVSAFAEEYWKRLRDYQVKELDTTMSQMGDLKKCLLASSSQDATQKCHTAIQDKMRQREEAFKKWNDINTKK